MTDPSGITPPNKPPEPPANSGSSSGSVDPNLFSSAFSDSSGNSFAEKAWGFDAAQAKKFISTLANTIISEIKHEDERAKETAEKLKQALEGQDDS